VHGLAVLIMIDVALTDPGTHALSKNAAWYTSLS